MTSTTNAINDATTRLLGISPASYDPAARTVDCVLSKGSPVARFYGTEVLEISRKAIVLDRVRQGLVPILDSHQTIGALGALGLLQSAWVADGALMGRIKFNSTSEGVKAEGMVERGEIAGISAGYRVLDWEISDSDGNVIDPKTDYMRAQDDDLVFTAVRWELLEASLVTVPADSAAVIRGYDFDHALPAMIGERNAAIERMKTRQRMHDRTQAALVRSDTLARMHARQRMADR
jgi:phage head maturation protease